MRKNGWKVIFYMMIALLGLVLPSEGAIKITQIMYNMYGNDGAYGCSGEFIEVCNTGASDVNISGYVLDDNDSNYHTSANISGGIIPAHGCAYLYNEDEIDKADFIRAWGGCNAIGVTGGGTKFSFSNSGDTIGLWSSIGAYQGDYQTHANTIDSVTYGDGDGDSWPASRDGSAIYLTDVDLDNDDGDNWNVATAYKMGWVKDLNRTVVSDLDRHHYAVISGFPRLILTEIMCNPINDEGLWEWVEVYNDWPVEADLTGYVLDDGSTSASRQTQNIAGGTIPPGKTAYLYDEDSIDLDDFIDVWGRCNAVGVSGWDTYHNSSDAVGLWGCWNDYLSDYNNGTQDNAVFFVPYRQDASWPNDVNRYAMFLTDLRADPCDGSNWENASYYNRGYYAPAGGMLNHGLPTTLAPQYDYAAVNTNPDGYKKVFVYKTYTGTRPSDVSSLTTSGNISHTVGVDVTEVDRGWGFNDFYYTDFNGSSEYIQSSSVISTLDDVGNDSFTVSAWFNADSVSGNRRLVSNVEDDCGFSLYIYDGKLKGGVYFTDNNGQPNYEVIVADDTLTAGNWYNGVFHVRKTSSNYELRLYVNNAAAASSVVCSTILPNGYINQSSEKPMIGAEPSDGSASGNYFNGKICAVEVANYDYYITDYLGLDISRDGSEYFGAPAFKRGFDECQDYVYTRTARQEWVDGTLDDVTSRTQVPFINDSYIPQGLAYDGDDDYFYMTLYWGALTDPISNTKLIGAYPTILVEMHADGQKIRRVFQLYKPIEFLGIPIGKEKLTFHAGGVAYYNQKIYIPVSDDIYRFDPAGSYVFSESSFNNPKMDQNELISEDVTTLYGVSDGGIGYVDVSIDGYTGYPILWSGATGTDANESNITGHRLNTSGSFNSTSPMFTFPNPGGNVQGITCHYSSSTEFKFYLITRPDGGAYPTEIYDATFSRATSACTSCEVVGMMPMIGEDATMSNGDLFTLSEIGSRFYQLVLEGKATQMYPCLIGFDVSNW